MAYAVFLITSSVCFLYIFYRERRIDIYLVATASGFLFFLSAYTGRVSGPSNYPSLSIPPTVYYAFSLYLAATCFSAFVSDRHDLAKPSPTLAPAYTSSSLVLSTTILWAASVCILFWRFPGLLLSGPKREFISQAGLLQTAMISFSTLALTCCLNSRTRGRIPLAITVTGFTVLTGSRTAAAITFVSLVLLHGRTARPVGLFRKRPLVLPVAIIVLVLMGASLKMLYGHFRSDGLPGVAYAISNTAPREIVLRGSEFLSTQYIFVDVVRTGYSTDGAHILRGPLGLLPWPREWFTTQSNEFNVLFQEELYPDVDYGMAYNPLAEFYSGARFGGVVIFIAALQITFAFLNRTLQSHRYRVWAPVVAIGGSLVGFYFHRNSVAVTFGMVRNVLYPFAFLIFLDMLWNKRPYWITRKRRAWIGFDSHRNVPWRRQGFSGQKRVLWQRN